MRLMTQRKWFNLTFIHLPSDLRSLIIKCKRLTQELDILQLYIDNQIMFPSSYIISIRTQMISILVAYANFLKEYIKEPKMILKIEKDLRTKKTQIEEKSEEARKEMGNRQKYFRIMGEYVAEYYDFLYSYIFDTMREAGEEYIKGIRKNISDIMIRKLGIIELMPPPEEERKLPKVIKEVKPSAK